MPDALKPKRKRDSKWGKNTQRLESGGEKMSTEKMTSRGKGTFLARRAQYELRIRSGRYIKNDASYFRAEE